MSRTNDLYLTELERASDLIDRLTDALEKMTALAVSAFADSKPEILEACNLIAEARNP